MVFKDNDEEILKDLDNQQYHIELDIENTQYGLNRPYNSQETQERYQESLDELYDELFEIGAQITQIRKKYTDAQWNAICDYFNWQ